MVLRIPVASNQSRRSSAVRLQEFFSGWFHRNGRILPWRDRNTTAFGVLVAEVLLRQTRAEMVAKVWPLLMASFPDAKTLSAANPKKLQAQVCGLGLGRQRTQALIELAQALKVRFNGSVPRDVQQLEQLPHVGLYSARAVACFAFGQGVPVVDSNVVRIISRLKGWEPAPDIRRAKHIWQVASNILPHRRAKYHNYGLLDFAAAVCRSRNPLCDLCPLVKNCSYFRVTHKQMSVRGGSASRR
jgi:A/G-specific adenine glycosylase